MVCSGLFMLSPQWSTQFPKSHRDFCIACVTFTVSTSHLCWETKCITSIFAFCMISLICDSVNRLELFFFLFFNFNADLMDFLEYLCEQIVCLFSFPNARSHSMFDTYVCAICSMRLCHVDSGNLNIKRNFRKIFRATNAETAAYSTRFVS